MYQFPIRSGPRPKTTPSNPHMQLDQQPTDASQRDLLAKEIFALPHVIERESMISVPGARALWLLGTHESPPDAFMIGSEFAHLHPGVDQSLHAMLPPNLAKKAIESGWAEQHPVAQRGLIPPNAVMLYAPRDASEREVIGSMIRAAYSYAAGEEE